MQTLSAKEANCGFGRLIDLARAEPVAAAAAKHGRTVVVMLAIEEYERLTALAEIGGDKTTYDLVKQALIDWGANKSSVLRNW
jgi:Antitoxin Phd_YefM, type II toxin-antitoxin system